MGESNSDNFATIPRKVKYIADKYPQREIFICVSKDSRYAFTAGSLLRLAGKFATRLLNNGFKCGDVIANTLPNSPERIITDFGVILAGCTGLNGQILLADGSDFLTSAWKARCNGIILCPENWSAAWTLLKPNIADHRSRMFSLVSHQQVPDLTRAVLVRPRHSAIDQPSFMDDLEMCREAAPSIDLCQPDDVMYVLSSSGSSGYSKLIPHSHREAVAIGSLGFGQGTSDQDTAKEFSVRPLGWVGGYPFKNYVMGKVRVLVDALASGDGCGPAEIVAAVTKESCSTGFIMPLEVEALLDHLTSEEIKSFHLKAIITGGQPIKRLQVARALLLAETVLVGYASSESGLIATYACQDANDFEDFCAGKPVKQMSVKVVDDEDNECQSGVVGKILIKGPSVFTGFFNRQQTPDSATPLAFTPDSWYRTEDFGWFNESGTLYVLGRAKDVISRDGIHLYPGWLEAKIIQHKDISEAIILPVSDKVRYHKICAIVKSHTGSSLNEMELEDFCRGIFLADTRDNYVPMPDFFKVLKGKDFPETATGKPDLHKLRKIAEDNFGVNE